MLKGCLYFLLFNLWVTSLIAQTPYWLQKAAGTGNDEVWDIVAHGNDYYITGYYTNPTMFGTTLLQPINNGEAFVAKINSNGNYIWAKRIGGANEDRGIAITVLPNGNVVVVGHFVGTISCDGLNLSSVGSSQDIFVASISSNGTLLWFKSFGNQGIDVISDIKADQDNNIIFTSQFAGSLTIGNTTLVSGFNSAINQFSYDILLCKLNTSGDVAWTRHGKSNRNNKSGKLAIGPEGTIFMSGNFTDTLQLVNTYPNNSISMGFLSRFAANGDLLWFRRVQSSVSDISHISYSDSLLYLTGSFVGTQRFANDETANSWQNAPVTSFPNRYYAAAYRIDGVFSFSISEGSESNVKPKAIRPLSNGGFVMAGQFSCSHTRFQSFYASNGIFISRGYDDIFIAEYNADKTLNRAKQIGGIGTDEVNAMTINSFGKPVIAGSFTERISSPAKPSWGNKPWYNLFGNSGGSSNYCGDPNYNFYAVMLSDGNKDILIANIADESRLTMDIFKREGGDCNRTVLPGSLQIYSQDPNDSCSQRKVRPIVSTGNVLYNGIVYDFYWNNSSNSELTFTPTVSGMVQLNAQAQNTCYSYTDATNVTVIESIPNPTISVTNAFLATLSSSAFCKNIAVPNSSGLPVLTGSAPPGSFVATWTLPNGTVVNQNPINFNPLLYGTYTYTITDPVTNCSKSQCIRFILPILDGGGGGGGGGGGSGSGGANLRFKTGDRILNDGDTLSGCKGDILNLELVRLNADSSISSSNIVNLGYWSSSNVNVFVSPSPTFDVHSKNITLLTNEHNNGYTIIKIEFFFLGQNGLAFSFSTNFYINIYPPPVFNYQITGNLSPVCPGDTARYQINTLDNYTLSLNNSNIIETYDPLSFYTFTQQQYHITFIDTTDLGCIGEKVDTFAMQYIQAPNIVVQPENAIVCDGQPVIMSLTGNYDEVVWIGPAGDTLSTQSQFSTLVPGLYYAVVNDENNCNLISNTIKVRDRSSFGFDASPLFICPGGTSEISLFVLEEDNINWLPPLSGNSLYKTVSQPGLYRFTASICGIIDTFNLVIQGPTITAGITISDTVLCQGSQITLQSIYVNDVSLTWTYDNSSGSTLTVTESGDYVLQMVDNDACVTYDTATVTVLPAPELPALPNPITFCGESIQLNSLFGESLLWYLDSTFVTNSPSFTYNWQDFQQQIYVAGQDYGTGCNSSKVAYPINAKKPFSIPLADSAYVLCQGETLNLQFSPSSYNATSYSFYGPPSVAGGSWTLLSTNSNYTLNNVSIQNNGFYHLVVEGDSSVYCRADTVRYLLFVKPVPQLTINSSDVHICTGETVKFWAQNSPGIVQHTWTYQGIQVTSDTLSIFGSWTSPFTLYLQYQALLANGCSVSVLDTILVGTRPPDVTYTDTLLDLCSGDVVQLTLTNNQTALWYSGNTQLTPQPTNSYTYTAVYNDQSLVVFNTDSNGSCPSNPTLIPIHVRLNVENPDISSVTLCPGTTHTFTYEPLSNVQQFKWIKLNLPDSILLATNQNSITLPSETGNFVIQVYPNETGCGLGQTFFSVSVHEPPQLTINPFPSDTFCLNNGTVYQSSKSFAVANSELYLNESSSPSSVCLNCLTHQVVLSQENIAELQTGTNILHTKVVTFQGCIVNAYDTLEVITASIPDFSVSNYAVCVGETIDIVPDTPGSYDWVQTNSFSYLTDSLLGLPTNYQVYALNTGALSYVVQDQNPTLWVSAIDTTTFCRSPFVQIPIQVKSDVGIPIFNSQQVCANDSVLIQFTPSDYLIGQFQWTFPNGTNSTESSYIVHGNDLDMMGTYKLIVYASELGCGEDSTSFSLESLPIPAVDIITDSLHLCTTRDYVLQANSSMAADLQWNYNGLTSTSNPLTINLSEYSGDSLIITGQFTTTQGCTVNQTLTVAVYPTPSLPSFTYPSVVCAQDKIILILNNVINPDQQFHFQSNVNFTQIGNEFFYTSQPQDSLIQLVSYIQTAHCTSDTLTDAFIINPVPVFSLGSDSLLFCLGEGTTLNGPTGFASYQWSTGEITESIQVSSTGAYSLLVTDQQGCTYSQTIHLLGSWPIFQFNSDSIEICSGDKLELSAPSGFENYQWSNGSDKNSIIITESGEYILVITDKNGCTYSDTLYAKVGNCNLDNMPNVFTPDGDGFNDLFILNPFGMVEYKMIIFNRWGQQLKEVYSNQGGWDGRDKNGNLMTSGVYFYVADVQFINNTNKEIKGTIQLIRD